MIVAFVPLMPGWAPEPMRVDSVTYDGSGQWYYGYVENMFDPYRVLVRGEDFGDAYEWLICHERIESDCAIANEVALGDEFYTEALEQFQNGEGNCLSMNDNGTILDTESIQLYGPIRVDFFAKAGTV